MQCLPFGPIFERWTGVGTMTSLEIGINPDSAVWWQTAEANIAPAFVLLM
jgi:hypothetical protein